MPSIVPNALQGRRTVAGRSIRWDQARADAAYRDGWWTGTTLADALRRSALEDPEHVLVKDGNAIVTAAALQERATCLARSMLARVPSGSTISIMLPNWYEATEIYLAAVLAGMVVNPVLPSLRGHDLGFIINDAGSRLVFIPEQFRQHDYVAMLDQVTTGMRNPPEVVAVRGAAGKNTPYSELFRTDLAVELPVLDPDAVHMIIYTSGTTGSPKGVMHTQNSLHALISQLRQGWLIEPGDKFLVPSPISHIGGSIYAFEMPLLLGTTAVLMEQWNADEAIAVLNREQITYMAGATPFLKQLLAAARDAGTNLPHLKVFICGGASVPSALVRDAAGYFAHAIVTRVYGSTEVPLTTIGVTDPTDVKHAAETEGLPAIAEVRLDQDSQICMRGPQMLAGYVHEEQEKSAFDADGFYCSGDKGKWIEGRYLVVSGRIKDIIIRHGENIDPKEIEDLLVDHPAISEVAIVGLPDEHTGERACAVIVPKGQWLPDVAAIHSYLKERGVARFKFPEQVEICEALPRNDAGKVTKYKIRANLLGKV